jgi:hypothetical protein
MGERLNGYGLIRVSGLMVEPAHRDERGPDRRLAPYSTPYSSNS